jgi:hypothetical protein
VSNFSWKIPFESTKCTMWLGILRLCGLTYRICTLYRVSNLRKTDATLSVLSLNKSQTLYEMYYSELLGFRTLSVIRYSNN